MRNKIRLEKGMLNKFGVWAKEQLHVKPHLVTVTLVEDYNVSLSKQEETRNAVFNNVEKHKAKAQMYFQRLTFR